MNIEATAGSVIGKSSASRAPAHDEIARLAFQLHLQAGCQQGRAEEDWIRAEEILRQEHAKLAPASDGKAGRRDVAAGEPDKPQPASSASRVRAEPPETEPSGSATARPQGGKSTYVCPVCEAPKGEWTGKGVRVDGTEYCCSGCATGAGCTCSAHIRAATSTSLPAPEGALPKMRS